MNDSGGGCVNAEIRAREEPRSSNPSSTSVSPKLQLSRTYMIDSIIASNRRWILTIPRKFQNPLWSKVGKLALGPVQVDLTTDEAFCN